MNIVYRRKIKNRKKKKKNYHTRKHKDITVWLVFFREDELNMEEDGGNSNYAPMAPLLKISITE